MAASAAPLAASAARMAASAGLRAASAAPLGILLALLPTGLAAQAPTAPASVLVQVSDESGTDQVGDGCHRGSSVLRMTD